MDADHFRRFVVRPALVHVGLHSAAAEALVLGTAVHESGGLTWLRQLGGGPALGVFQIEPETHDDIWDNYLRYRPQLAGRVASLAAPWPARHAQLVTNLAYAAAVTRVHYLRVPAPLPAADDLAALADYWKAHFNTPLGAGRPDDFVRAWRRHVEP